MLGQLQNMLIELAAGVAVVPKFAIAIFAAGPTDKLPGGSGHELAALDHQKSRGRFRAVQADVEVGVFAPKMFN